MTPSEQGQVKDSIQLQIAVRMFVEYLLEHKAIVQTVMQEQHAKKDGSTPVEIAEKPEKKRRGEKNSAKTGIRACHQLRR